MRSSRADGPIIGPFPARRAVDSRLLEDGQVLAITLCLQLVFGDETQGGGVYAIALASGLGAVIEDMAKM